MNPTGSHVRYRVLGLLGLLSMITYLDRVSFGSVAPLIQREFDLSNTQKGLLFSAFATAYALFEVPTGWLGDRFGPKKTLLRIVLWWSGFTAVTGLIWPTPAAPLLGFLALLGVRFFFGMGEAGAYPNITRALQNWFPLTERGLAQGTIWMAGRLGGGLTPFIVAQLFAWLAIPGSNVIQWRPAYWIFGGLGVVWCMFFIRLFVDRPANHPHVSAKELDLITRGRLNTTGDHARVDWRALLRSRNLWALCLMYFCSSYGWYFNITFLPGYLKERFQMDESSLSFSLSAGAPLLSGSIACLVGGLTTDGLVRLTGSLKLGRRSMGVMGHGVCAGCYFLAVYAQSLELFITAVALAAFWNDLTMGSSWSVCQDIGGAHTGVVAGCMNTVGNLGGAAAGVVTGLILDHFAGSKETGWQVNLFSFAMVYVVAVLLWLRVNAAEPVFPASATPA